MFKDQFDSVSVFFVSVISHYCDGPDDSSPTQISSGLKTAVKSLLDFFCSADKKDGDGSNAIGLDEVEVKPEPDEDNQIPFSGLI